MSGPHTVTPYDPNKVAGTQQTQYNQPVAINNQELSAISQKNPYGTLQYSTSIDPVTGLPKLSANQTFTPEQQAIFDQLQKAQTGIGGTAGSAIGNMFGQYTGDPDLINKAQGIVDQNLSPMNAAWERFMAPQRDQLDNNMRNQGILPGTPAYQQQMDMLTQQQQLTKGSWLAQFQPQAFQEAQTNYQLPLSNVAQMMAFMQPGNINQNLNNTPGFNEQTADFQGAATEAKNQALKNEQLKTEYDNNLISGGLKTGAAVLAAPMTGGGSLAGLMMSNMFTNPGSK